MRNDLHDHIQALGLDNSSNLFEETISYLFKLHGTPIKTYHVRFSKACSFAGLEITPSQYRVGLYDTAYTGVTLKYFAAYVAFMFEQASARQLKTVASKFTVSVRDAQRVINMMSNRPYRMSVVKHYKAAGFQASDFTHAAYLRDIRKGHDNLVALDTSIAKNVAKKLTWVARAHNTRTADLCTEVKVQMLSTYYSSLPTKCTDEHIHLKMCTSLHSRINNLCDYHSASKRKRQVRTIEQGEVHFRYVEASESHLNKFATADNALSIEELGGCDDSRELHNYEFERSVATLFRGVRKGTKREALYNAMLGRDVGGFSKFLRTRRLLRSTKKTVREWLIDKPFDYLAGVFSEWLGASQESVRKAMNNMALTLL